MTPTPANLADGLERYIDQEWPTAAQRAKFVGAAVIEHRALIVRALRALGEPDEAAVERAAEAMFTADGFAPPCESIVWPFSKQPEVIRQVHLRRARAALTARAADE